MEFATAWTKNRAVALLRPLLRGIVSAFGSRPVLSVYEVFPVPLRHVWLWLPCQQRDAVHLRFSCLLVARQPRPGVITPPRALMAMLVCPRVVPVLCCSKNVSSSQCACSGAADTRKSYPANSFFKDLRKCVPCAHVPVSNIA